MAGKGCGSSVLTVTGGWLYSMGMAPDSFAGIARDFPMVVSRRGIWSGCRGRRER